MTTAHIFLRTVTGWPPEPREWRIVSSTSIDGPLRSNPYRLVKQLRAPLLGSFSARRGQYRVIYRLHEVERTLDVTHIVHRRNAYRPR